MGMWLEAFDEGFRHSCLVPCDQVMKPIPRNGATFWERKFTQSTQKITQERSEGERKKGRRYRAEIEKNTWFWIKRLIS